MVEGIVLTLSVGVLVGLLAVLAVALRTFTPFFRAVTDALGDRSWLGRTKTGAEGMVGDVAVVATPFGPTPARGIEGKVHVRGELWAARLEPAAVRAPMKGEEVEVTAVDGLMLTVRPLASASAEPRQDDSAGT